MDAFRAEAIRLSLKQMFRPEGWFCIIDLLTCLKSAGTVAAGAPARARATLR